MATRRRLQSLAHDLLGTFVSRNNDLDGYWGLGQLYLQQLQLLARPGETGAQTPSDKPEPIFLDLLTAGISLASEAFDGMALHYARCFLAQLVHHGISRSWVVSARLQIRFQAGAVEAKPWLKGRGPLYLAELEILDDRGRWYRAVQQGHCEPHDPVKELRSSRRAVRFARTGQELLPLESRLMQALLAGEDPLLAVLRKQLERARVTRREFTGRGFYCSFFVEDPFEPVRPANFVVDDLWLEVAGIPDPVAVRLFVRHGCLDCLEAVAQTEDWPATPQITGISYACKQLVSEGVYDLSTSSLRNLEQTRRAWSLS